MEKILRSVKTNTKKYCSLFLALVLVCSTILMSSVKLGTVAAASAATVPTDVVFESLEDTCDEQSKTLTATGTSTLQASFGTVTDTTKGFAFSLNKLQRSTGGILKIGLYNTGENNVWNNGFMLFVHNGIAENTVRFQLRGSGEADLGQMLDIEVDSNPMTIQAWYKDNTMHIAVDGEIILSAENTNNYTLGNYMAGYNDWQESAVFGHVEITKSLQIPTDVTFETVADTTGNLTTTVGAKGSGSLGQVTDSSTGFTFDLNKLQRSTSGMLKIGLYNTGENNVWNNGYMLFVHNGLAENTVRFQLRGSGEADLGQLVDVEVDGDPMTIHAWYKDGTMYIAVEEQIILQHTSSYTLGTHMSVYNEWTEDAVFTGTMTPEASSQIPTDVTFETVADTTGNLTTTVGANGSGSNQVALGQVTDSSTGFTFDLNRLLRSTGGMLKIGLYNTTENNVWNNGYMLFVHNGLAENMVRFQLRGSGEADLGQLIDIEVDSDPMTIHAWCKDGTMYIAVEEQIILQHTSSYTLGTYMNVYNDWSEAAVFTGTLTPEQEVSSQIPTDVTFETVADTTGNATTTVGATGSGSNQVALGQVTDSSTGFTFDLNKLLRSTGGMLKIGLYNAVENNVWNNGYMLFVHNGIAENTVRFQLRGSEEADLGQLVDVEVASDPMTVHAWYKDGIMYIAVEEQIILQHTSSYTLGTYMNVYNEWTEEAVFTGIATPDPDPTPDPTPNPEPDPEPETPSQIPTDVVFETVADTTGDLTTTVVSTGLGALGAVTDSAKGFTFDLNKLQRSTGGILKIGLYNTVENDVWKDGYMLFVHNGIAENTVRFQLRGSGEEELGQMVDVEVDNDPMTVHAWYKEGIMYIAVEEQIILKYAGTYNRGTYMNAYNEWSEDAVFTGIMTMEPQPDTEPEPEEQPVPSDIVFEDLGVTAQLNSITTAKEAATSLGELSNKKVGFKFKVTMPEPAEGGDLKIGLYNTAEFNPWSDGYIVVLSQREERGTIGVAIRKGQDETLLAYLGNLTGFTGDTVTVCAWIDEDVFYLGMNDKIVYSWENDGTVKLGTHMTAWNQCSFNPVIYTINEIVEPYNPVGESIPSDIAFEDIGVTLEENSIPMISNGTVYFGKVSDMKKGFQVKVTVPDKETTGNVKVGFYNTEVGNPWTDGYLVIVSPTEEEGTLGFSLYKGKDEVPLTTTSKVSGLKDYVTISTWIKEERVYVAVEGTVVASWVNDGSVKLGKHMAAYSEWTQEGEYRSVKEIVIPPYVDTSKNVEFEDLSVTLVKETVECETASSAYFGEVTDTKTGFSLIMNALSKKQTNKPIKLGFYNTGESNPWLDGYLVAVNVQEDGNYAFTLYQGKDEVLIKTVANVKVSGSKIQFDAWLTDGNTFHFKVNGEEIFTYVDKNKEVAVGTHMAVYNDRSEKVVFKTVNPIVDTSKDVTFMDLGKTLKLNSVTSIPKMVADLGRLQSTKNGFEFKISMPSSSDDGKNIKIGLYNMEKKNPWTDGYLFILSPRANGDVGISLRMGSGEALLAYPDDLKGLTGEYLTVRAWVSDIDGNVHIFHVSVNGTEVITYKNRDGAVKLGTYLSVYQEGATPVEIRTIEEVIEPSDLYLKRYGDPTAMGNSSATKNDTNVDLTDDVATTKNLLPFILSGSALVVLIAAVVVAIAMKRKKEK